MASENAPEIISDQYHCTKCGATLVQLDKALYRKLVSRGAETFMCKECLAGYLGTTAEKLDELAEYYRAQGCTLFD